MRVEPTEQKIGVSDRGLGAAEAVAGRPGRSTGAARPDAQRAGAVHVSNGAAARADRLHGGHRQPHRVAAELALRGGLGDAVGDEADVGGGAAHVEGERALNTECRRDVRGGGDPGRRAGRRQRQRPCPRRLHRHHAAGGVQQVQRGARGRKAEALVQLVYIRGGERHHGGVEHGRAGALVLAELGVDVARHAHVGEVPLQMRAQRPLVLRVGVAVQQADGHALHALARQRRHELGDLVEGERRFDRPVGTDALGHLESQPPRHGRRRLGRGPEVVEMQAAHARDLEHVPEATRGDQADDGAAALDDRVGDDGRAVRDGSQRRAADQRRQPVHHPEGGVGRRRRDLPAGQPARRRTHDEVRERPADVDADAAARHARDGNTRSGRRGRRVPTLSTRRGAGCDRQR